MASNPISQWIAQLSDGSEIDWERCAEQEPESAQAVARLRRLSRITSAFRQCAHGGDAERAGRARFQWGHLQVIELIGEGGFGLVYRAYDQLLDRDVALKLRRDSQSNLASTRAFIAEARRLAQVRHPNVLAVHGAGVHDDRVGLWADLLSGQTLADRIRAGPVPVTEALRIVGDVLKGLCAIHAAGLVHGDIKASNLMLEPDGRAVLMDFGAGADSRHGDQPGLVQGSPLCMAPELLAGGAHDAATDLYSTGVLIHYMLSGRYPVAGESVDELRAAHRRRGSRRPSQDFSGLPREFAALLDDLLSPHAECRPSAEQALARLQWLAGKPERRRRQHMVAAAMISLALALGVSLYALQRVSVARSETLAQYQQAERQRQHAVAVKDFIVEGVRSAAPMQRDGVSSLLGVYRGMAQRVDTELQDFPEALADMQVAIGRGLYDFGDHQAGVELAERGVAALSALPDLAPERLIEPLETMAILYRHEQRLDEAERSIRRALQIAESYALDERYQQALALRARNLLANVLGDRGDLLGALRQHQRVLSERAALLGTSAPALAANYNNLGRSHEDLEQWPEALQAFQQAEAILLQNGEADSIKIALVRSGIAQALIGLGHWERGEALLQQVRERFLRDYGPAHSYLISTEIGLAELDRRRGDGKAALQRLDGLLASPEYRPSFYFWLSRARAAADLQNWPVAHQSYQSALTQESHEKRPYLVFLRAAIAWTDSPQSRQSNLPDKLAEASEDLRQRGLTSGVELELVRRWQAQAARN